MAYIVELDEIDLGDLGSLSGFAVGKVDADGNATVQKLIVSFPLTPTQKTDIIVTHMMTRIFRLHLEELIGRQYARAKADNFKREDWEREAHL